MSRKKRTYADFKVGDVFVGVGDNEEVFLITGDGLYHEHWDVLTVVAAKGSQRGLGHREAWLSKTAPVSGVYDVYRAGKIVCRT